MIWSLDIGIWDFFVFWCLEFEILLLKPESDGGTPETILPFIDTDPNR